MSYDVHLQPLLEYWKNYVPVGFQLVPICLNLVGGKKQLKDPLPWKAQDYSFEDFEKLISSFPGIAIKTGEVSGIIVVDIDIRENKNGWGTLNTYGITKDYFKGVPLVQTPSGGEHYYFKYDYAYPDALKTSRTLTGAGIDIRSNGGLVFAPPTVVPGYGSYEWKVQILDTGLLPVVPQEVIDFIESHTDKEIPVDQVSVSPEPPHDKPDSIQAPVTTDSEWSKIKQGYLDDYATTTDRSRLDYGLTCDAKRCGIPDDEIRTTLLLPPNAKAKDPGHFDSYIEMTINKAEQELEGKVSKINRNDFLDKDKKLKPNEAAKYISETNNLINCPDTGLLVYKEGTYSEISQPEVNVYIESFLTDLNYPINKGIRSSIYDLLDTKNITKKDEFNPDGFLNLNNGILKLDTLELIPHSPEYKFLHKLDINYDSAAKSKRWEEALNLIFHYSGYCNNCSHWQDGCTDKKSSCYKSKTKDQQDKINSLQEFLGYCLVKAIPEKLSLWLYGSPDSGKTLICNTIQNNFGPALVTSYTINHLNEPPVVAQFFRRLINIGDDSGSGIFNESIFKALTGNSYVSGKHLYYDPFTFHNYCKFIFTFNILPTIKDTSGGTYSRLLILETPNVFTKSPNGVGQFKEIPNYSNELKSDEDRAGILNWILTGYKRYKQNNSIFIPESSKGLVKELMDQTPPLVTFLTNLIITSFPSDNSIHRIAFSSFHSSYCIHLKKSSKRNIPAPSKIKLSREINSTGSIGCGGVEYSVEVKAGGGSIRYLYITKLSDDSDSSSTRRVG